MALPKCPICRSPMTQANVNTLNCLACGCVFDFDNNVVATPDQGVTTTEDVSWSEPADEVTPSKSKKAVKASA